MKNQVGPCMLIFWGKKMKMPQLGIFFSIMYRLIQMRSSTCFNSFFVRHVFQMKGFAYNFDTNLP